MLLNFAPLLVVVAALATASPSPVVVEERSPQFSIVPLGPEFYLQTKVLSGDASKNGLYGK